MEREGVQQVQGGRWAYAVVLYAALALTLPFFIDFGLPPAAVFVLWLGGPFLAGMLASFRLLAAITVVAFAVGVVCLLVPVDTPFFTDSLSGLALVVLAAGELTAAAAGGRAMLAMGRRRVQGSSKTGPTAAPMVTNEEGRVLDLLTNAAEPTWILLEDEPGLAGDRTALEALLMNLENRGLVRHAREPSVNPAAAPLELDDWWSLTQAGWQALGLPVPSNHRGGLDGDSGGETIPLEEIERRHGLA